jgi:hypothetical protein
VDEQDEVIGCLPHLGRAAEPLGLEDARTHHTQDDRDHV